MGAGLSVVLDGCVVLCVSEEEDMNITDISPLQGVDELHNSCYSSVSLLWLEANSQMGCNSWRDVLAGSESGSEGAWRWEWDKQKTMRSERHRREGMYGPSDESLETPDDISVDTRMTRSLVHYNYGRSVEADRLGIYAINNNHGQYESQDYSPSLDIFQCSACWDKESQMGENDESPNMEALKPKHQFYTGM